MWVRMGLGATGTEGPTSPPFTNADDNPGMGCSPMDFLSERGGGKRWDFPANVRSL